MRDGEIKVRHRDIFEAIVEMTKSLVGSTVISVMAFDRKKRLEIKACRGIPESIKKKVRTKHEIADWVMRNKQSALVVDVEQDERFSRHSRRRYRTKSCLSVPIIVDEEVRGIINTTDKQDSSEYTERDREVLELFAEFASMGIMCSELMEQARQLNIELEKLNHMRDAFMTSISHELRTPLTSVKGALSILLDTAPETSEHQYKKFLEIAQRNADRLCSLVNGMLDVRRLHRHEIIITKKETELSGLVCDAVACMRNAAAKKNVKMRMDLPAHKIRASIDPEKVRQAIVLLLENGVKFVHDGGRVSVSVRRGRNCATVVVSDNGTGIPAEHLDRIFESFYQVDRSLTRTACGAGIGLSICKGIIEAHGGQIRAESPPGCGSRFVFTIPIC